MRRCPSLVMARLDRICVRMSRELRRTFPNNVIPGLDPGTGRRNSTLEMVPGSSPGMTLLGKVLLFIWLILTHMRLDRAIAFNIVLMLMARSSRAMTCKRNRAMTCKRNRAMTMRYCLALTFVFAAATPSLAVEPSEQLKNPILEARARAIGSGLRCLVCQNETIDESNASLAHDIRVLLRERLTEGDTDAQAVQAIVNRYGEFVLLKPPVQPATYVLWFGPLGILLAGLIGGAVWLRGRSATTGATAPLTPDERGRLDAIMRETDR
jgi:cytochrome c-type biogenesis protein CcmH